MVSGKQVVTLSNATFMWQANSSLLEGGKCTCEGSHLSHVISQSEWSAASLHI